MDLNKIINDLLDNPLLIDSNSYYHAFSYHKRSFSKMVNDGIKAKILLQRRGTGFNGLFYVSLSKDEDTFYSAYNLLRKNPAFIIDSTIKTIKTKNMVREGAYPLCFCNSFLPLRESAYDDEYQRFLKVPASKIKAIRYELNSALSLTDLEEKLYILQQIMEDLESLDSSLDVVDIDTHRILSRRKVLSLKIK